MTASRPPASRPGVTIIPIHGHTPKIHDSAFIAPGCTIIGNVEIGADSSVWYNCVLRADVSRIVIGERTNIQDSSVCHCDPERPGDPDEPPPIAKPHSGLARFLPNVLPPRGVLPLPQAVLLPPPDRKTVWKKRKPGDAIRAIIESMRQQSNDRDSDRPPALFLPKTQYLDALNVV